MDTGIIKHSYTPATAEEIRRAVGVTEEDRKAVDRVLAKLRSRSSDEDLAGRSIAAVARATKPAASKKTRSIAKKSASRKRPE